MLRFPHFTDVSCLRSPFFDPVRRVAGESLPDAGQTIPFYPLARIVRQVRPAEGMSPRRHPAPPFSRTRGQAGVCGGQRINLRTRGRHHGDP